MSVSEAPVLDVREVSVELGGREVVQRVKLAVARGELVGLLGPNGAGKTTLVRTVLGLIRPSHGQVVLGRSSASRRASIGYVPQRHDFAWDFPVSVAGAVMSGLTGQLGLWRRPGREQWRAVADALGRVRLSHLAQRPVGQLSGGQRQRVLVARALALHPQLLLLDEPFTGLDMPTQEALALLFTDLAREGRGVLLTTHDLASALATCDRVALLNRRLVAEGPPSQLAANPQPWMDAYGVGPDSPLLRVVKAV